MNHLKVLKFGGTSVGSVKNMLDVQDIIHDNEPKLVVLSAMSGTTNALLQIVEKAKEKDSSSAKQSIIDLEKKYEGVIAEMRLEPDTLIETKAYIQNIFTYIKNLVEKAEDEAFFEKKMVAQGEILSTFLFHKLLLQNNIPNNLISSLDFMIKNEQGEPDLEKIEKKLREIINPLQNINIIITQGFICRDAQGNIDNLSRGGSDYTASIIGAALGVDEIQIWTDIDGFHNNDPRIVENTKPIRQLSFDEAAELAYFGAKILHPQSVLPAQERNIPVRLKNTMQPDAPGTIIMEKAMADGIKAVAAKDNITVVKIKSARMFLTHGFLEKVFSIFAHYETPIDVITTSEIAVSLTIDQTEKLDKIVGEVSKFANVEVEKDFSIICIVGQNIVKDAHANKVFDLMRHLPIRMISYGGSRNNISLLVQHKYKNEALLKLNQLLF